MNTLAHSLQTQLLARGLTQAAASVHAGKGPPPEGEDDYLVEALLEELRKVPDEWEDAVIQQVQLLRCLSEDRRPIRIIGEEDEGEGDQDPRAQLPPRTRLAPRSAASAPTRPSCSPRPPPPPSPHLLQLDSSAGR